MSTTSKRPGSTLKRRRRIPVRCEPREPRPHVFYPHIVPKVVSNHKLTQNQRQIEQLRMRVAVLKYIIRYREQEERLQNSQPPTSSHKRAHPSGGGTPRPGPHKVPKRGVSHTPSAAGLHTPRHAYALSTPVTGTPGVATAGAGLHTPRGVNGGVGLVTPQRILYKLNYDPDYPPNPLIRKFANVVVSLMNEPTAPAFNQPVDHVLLRLPRYPEIIKRPMDLGTIKRNIEEGKYGTVEELKRDVDQVWINCKTFNGPLLPITKSAIALQEKWEAAFAAIARDNGLRIPTMPATPSTAAVAVHHPHTNGVLASASTPLAARGASTPMVAGTGGASASSTLASPLDADERWLQLGPNDMDPVTGRVIELNLMQVEKLSEEMLKLNAADVMTAVKILKQDPNYAPPLNGKLQFTPARYSKETQRKLQNYFNHLSMTGKTRKRAVTPARVTTQRGGVTPSGGPMPRSAGAMMNGVASSSRVGPQPVAQRLGGGLTPGGGGGSATPRGGGGLTPGGGATGPRSLLKGDDDDEDTSSDDDSDDDDESDSDSSDDDSNMRTSQSPTTGNNFKKRVKWNFANKVKKDAEARKRKAEEAARLATTPGGTGGGTTPNHRPPGSLTPGAVPRGSSALPSSSMTPTAASGARHHGWPTPGAAGGFHRMNSPMGPPPTTNRAISSPFPTHAIRHGQSPMHPGMRPPVGPGGVPPPPTPGSVAAARGHVPPPPPQRGAPSRPGINISQQTSMMARMQSQFGM